MSEFEEKSLGESEPESMYDEPDFDAAVDEEDEANRIEAVHQRNRKRVLVPLILLIALFGLLSLFGEKGPSPDVKPAPVDEKSKP